MGYNFNIGQKLVLELTSREIVEGEFVAGGRNRVELINISVYPSEQKIKGPHSYYRSEITNVRSLNKNKSQDDNGSIVNGINGHPKQADINTSPKKVIGLRQAEYQRLKSMSQEYTYMTSIDSRYYAATEHLNNCENVGVVCIATSSGKMAKLSLLVLSSWDQIYVFDMILFNQKKFPPELKAIFETDLIKKIVHDSRLMVDLLNSCYKTKVVNLFDVQIADVMIRKRETKDETNVDKIKSLSECLVYYFNLPSVLIERAQETELKKFESRPLSPSRQFRAALLATYLLTLKNHLETKLLEDFYKAVDVYSRSLISCTVLESQKNLKSTKLCDILTDSDLEEFSPKRKSDCNGI